ncbi:MAG: hypothetical protein AAF547_06515 [Actinomycetota bacterium]
MAWPDDGPGEIGRIQQSGAIVDLFGGTEITVSVLPKAAVADPTRPIWRSHFADCPDAEEWRKKAAA